MTETAGEKVYRRLRNDIIFGRLAPSQKLKLDGLKDGYGISISTLRELLNRLTSEGLIVAESARGFEVAPVSAENFKELANLRLLLECSRAAALVCGSATWSGKAVSSRRITSWRRWKSGCWPATRGSRSVEAVRLGISSRAAVGLRLAALAGSHAAVFDKYLRYLMIAVIFREPRRRSIRSFSNAR